MSKHFPGFPPEGQYWQFPTIINGYVNLLSGNEFKVLWYILRHTYGFQKFSDKISISQIMNGIKKKNGDIFDTGTGIKHRKTVTKALEALEKYKFIRSNKKTGKTTLYYPLVQKMNHTSSKNEPVTSSKNEPTIYKSTIDKKRESTPSKNSITKHQKYLENIPLEDILEFSKRFGFSEKQVKYEAEKCLDWLLSKGRQSKNYKAQFRNWLRKAGEFKEQNMNKEKTLYEMI